MSITSTIKERVRNTTRRTFYALTSLKPVTVILGGDGIEGRIGLRSDGKGNLTVVEGAELDAFGKQKFHTTLQELLEEKEAVASLLPT
jgi:hypothetical protein